MTTGILWLALLVLLYTIIEGLHWWLMRVLDRFWHRGF